MHSPHLLYRKAGNLILSSCTCIASNTRKQNGFKQWCMRSNKRNNWNDAETYALLDQWEDEMS